MWLLTFTYHYKPYFLSKTTAVLWLVGTVKIFAERTRCPYVLLYLWYEGAALYL